MDLNSFCELFNYFDSLPQLFSDLYPAKYLNTLTRKPFFPCREIETGTVINLGNSFLYAIYVKVFK